MAELSRAVVALVEDDAKLRLDALSVVRFSTRNRSWFDLLRGVLNIFTRTPGELEVNTPYFNAAVEGTEFALRVDDEVGTVWVIEGRVRASNASGALSLGAGEAAQAGLNQAPQRLLVASLDDAVAWALHYPPVVDLRPGRFEGAVAQGLARYADNDVAGALAALPRRPSGDEEVETLRGALLLAVGRVAEARATLESLGADNGEAVALEAVIAVAQNRRDEALTLAQQAVALAPDSPVAQVALSYARQAEFDIDGALVAARQAVALDRANALAWSRVAELTLASGDYRGALGATERAVALDPRSARALTINGYALLARQAPARAQAVFAQAVTRSPGDPLPRLGLGLARIRQGELAAGRDELELAASLDPYRSLGRSYLGKAYFEENRFAAARGQYGLAQQFDPADPTPWFYQALLAQAENRPVEALGDLERSIALNDNRLVYRSQLLIDDDAAARGASLGRIYRELGFEELALREASRSVASDPGNFAAHRLLADAYRDRQRVDLARASALLQSQLTQPLSQTAIQPQLTQTDLGILRGAGPSAAGFNEFNSLFVRDGLRIQAHGVVGNRDTLGDEVIVSALFGRLAFNLGQFHYETDGFGGNTDQERDIYTVFAQVEPFPELMIQAEYRRNEVEEGDPVLRVDPDDINDTLRQTDEEDEFRLGARYRIGKRWQTLLSFFDTNVEESVEVSLGPVGTELLTSSDTIALELQQLYRGSMFSVRLGSGYLDQESDFRDTFLDSASRQVLFTQDGAEELQHYNAYLYLDIEPLEDLQLLLGISGDDFDLDQGDFKNEQRQINPKLGITWTPHSLVALRAAAFRTLTRPIAASQTLEPVVVAGFNQFFDDVAGAETWRYGLGWDQRWSPYLHSGLEYSLRQSEAFQQSIQVDTLETSQDTIDIFEREGRAYLYWTPRPWLALSGEYIYEDFETDFDELEGSRGFYDLQNQRLELDARWISAAGWRGQVVFTLVDQDAAQRDRATNPETGVVEPIDEFFSDRFWLMDVALGYRLPADRGEVSLSIKNVFDKDFEYQETPDFGSPLFYPERLIFLNLSLSFP
ncbi:MAG: TonB-dependent receptor domain-containing protein [Candidatus Competibacterales bacterium]